MDIKDLSLRKADIAEGEVATAPSSENNTRKIQRTDILIYFCLLMMEENFGQDQESTLNYKTCPRGCLQTIREQLMSRGILEKLYFKI